MNAELVLIGFMGGPNDIQRSWPLQINENQISIEAESLLSALEIMRGCYNNRLEIRVNNTPIRRMEHLNENA